MENKTEVKEVGLTKAEEQGLDLISSIANLTTLSARDLSIYVLGTDFLKKLKDNSIEYLSSTSPESMQLISSDKKVVVNKVEKNTPVYDFEGDETYELLLQNEKDAKEAIKEYKEEEEPLYYKTTSYYRKGKLKE